MGLGKDIGKLAGALVGAVVAAPIAIAGEVVNSDFLREVGDGVFKVTEHTGELLGNVTEGVGEIAYGTIKSDSFMQNDGFKKVWNSGTTYVSGVTKGIGKMAMNGLETVDAIIDGDTEKAMKVGKELVKTVAIGSLAVGVADVIDNIDFVDDDTPQIVENPNTHHVTPHTRTLADGRTIWVDGDGNTNVDTFDGWYQTNPNYRG